MLWYAFIIDGTQSRNNPVALIYDEQIETISLDRKNLWPFLHVRYIIFFQSLLIYNLNQMKILKLIAMKIIQI
jgi:hypothetical protein